MKFAVISDIHANLQALEAVISDAHSNDIDQFVCLGDIVGYGPQPRECVELIRSLDCPIVRGNHDYYAVGRGDLTTLHPDAQSSLEWTRDVLDDQDKEWLAALPFSRRVGRFLISHATPRRPNLFGYIHTVSQAREALQNQKVPVCFVGHTHIPNLFKHTEDATSESCGKPTILSSTARYLCNPGAIGQPRDNDIRSSYALYDRSRNMISWKRVEYDVEKTQSLLKRCHMPASLTSRLTSVA